MTIRSLLSRCRPRFSRRVWITLGIAALCFLVSWIFFVIRTGMASRLHDQRAAFTWSENGTGVSQLTVFFPYDLPADTNTIKQLEYNVRQELIKASVIESDDEDPGFVTSCCAAGVVQIGRSDTNRSASARAIGTWGDFFRFHPVTLLSGSIYAQDLLTKDQILIDENLAWQLFGSHEVTGKTVQIGGVAHTIAGVFRIPADGAIEKRSGIPENLCFLSLESLCQLGNPGNFGILSSARANAASSSTNRSESGTSTTGSGTSAGKTSGSSGSASGSKGGSAGGSKSGASTGYASAARADGAAIGTASIRGVCVWEIVMPDPVKNFALQIIRDKTRADKGEAYVVENSRRFEPEALAKNLRGGVTRGMQTEPVVYPYWENIARGYTNIFSVLWLVQTVFMTAGILILTVLCVLAWRRRTWTVAGLWQTLMDKKYDFESRMRYTHDKWEHF